MTEKILLNASGGQIKNIASTVWAIRQQIKDRDIGDFVGLPLADAVKAAPPTVKLTIFLYSVPAPPFRQVTTTKFVRAYCNIPDVVQGELTWTNIKNACGGSNGYEWGRFRCTVVLDNRRQMQVYGGTAQIAEQQAKNFLEFTHAKPMTISVAEEKEEYLRTETGLLYKPTTFIYPAYFTLINTQKIQQEQANILLAEKKLGKGKSLGSLKKTTKGVFNVTKTPKIPLWVNKEPSNVRQMIQSAFTAVIPLEE